MYLGVLKVSGSYSGPSVEQHAMYSGLKPCIIEAPKAYWNNQSDIPLFTAPTCLIATYLKELRTNNLDGLSAAMYMLISLYSNIPSPFVSAPCRFADTFGISLRNCSNPIASKRGQHLTLTCVDSTLVPSWCLYVLLAFIWLAYSGNKYFRVGPNILEKMCSGGNQAHETQIPLIYNMMQLNVLILLRCSFLFEAIVAWNASFLERLIMCVLF